MYTYFSNFFPRYQCGFRKGYSVKHCLSAMTKKMKEARDSNKVCAVVLTNLSKVFDCLLHNLLIAKLHAFALDLKFLKVIHAYVNNRIRVTKVGSFYSKILQIIYGVPQGSILDPRTSDFSNYVDFSNYGLREVRTSDFSNYAEDTTRYNCGSTFLKLYQTWR